MSDTEHPVDRQTRLEVIDRAAETIDAFFEANKGRFKALVETYADDRARVMLEHLREDFWSEMNQ